MFLRQSRPCMARLRERELELNDVVRIMKATEFAAGKHSKQQRKGEEAEPYVNHLIEVARLVAEATDGRADMVIAALLHDTVEDQAVKFDEIVALFGSRVSSLVAEVTDDKNLPKEERKTLQIVRAPLKSPDAAIIALADKISNLLAIAKSPPPWPIERKRAYVDWARAVVSGLSFKPPALLARFEEAAALASDTIEAEQKTRSLEISDAEIG
jgi:(p)ppGpp synthase/HD superfamily hydrolase